MPLKVIIWSTGTVGSSALRQILTNDAYELAGVYVHSPEKSGADAATLIGLPACGVLATTDRDSILATDADAVVYAPQAAFDPAEHDRDVFELLRSGKNVLTPVAYWYPAIYGPGYVAQIEEACSDGQSSLYGTGENPGLFLSRLGTVVATSVSELACLELLEFVDVSTLAPSLIFDVMGFGLDPSALGEGSITASLMDRYFKEEIYLTASQLGVELDDFQRTVDLASINHDIEIGSHTVPAGGNVAQRYRWSGVKNGSAIISIQNTWYIYDEVPGWDLSERWLINISARPALSIEVRGSARPNLEYVTAMEITATTIVNAIQRVCSAPPGIVYPEATVPPPNLWSPLVVPHGVATNT